MVQTLKAHTRRLVPLALLRSTVPVRRAVGNMATTVRIRSFCIIPPRTLNQKIRYRMLYDRNPLLTTFCDKWAVRQYVADRVGEDVLPKVYALVSDPEELDIDALPDRCVVKPTHGSGAVIIVDDRADPEIAIPDPQPGVEWTSARVRVCKEQLRSESFFALTRSWLGAIYGRGSEPAYKTVPPRLIVEELLPSPKGESPPDVRFFLVDGVVRFITVDSGWAPNVCRAVLAANWSQLKATLAYPAPVVQPTQPRLLPNATDIAVRLGRGVDFIRVDLYLLDDRVVFGELTNYHAGGRQKMSPQRIFVGLVADWKPHLEYGPFLFRRLRRCR